MHIQVTDVVYDEEIKLTMVEFSTPFGVGVGEWRHGSPERYSHVDTFVRIHADKIILFPYDV